MESTSAKPHRTHRTENFPVASRLIDARRRPPIMAFYDFARTSDDVADDAGLLASEKLARLDRVEACLLGQADDEPKPVALRETLRTLNLDRKHAQDLLAAFRLDVTKNRYRNWDELIAYCEKSASPVGRYVLDVYGEPRSTWPASDALCTTLQIINHLQDCMEDFRDLDRCYLPLDLLAAKGARLEDLTRPASTPALRASFDEICDRLDELLARSRLLSRQVSNRRLALEISVIQRIAERLVGVLRERDPLADDAHLHGFESVRYAALGILRGASDRVMRRWTADSGMQDTTQSSATTAADGAASAASGSSFYAAMRVLPPERRNAIFEVYGFCRAVDDVADEPCWRGREADELAAWRRRIDAIYAGAPEPEQGRLAAAVSDFGLKREDFHSVIKGMEMDVAQRMRAPDFATLDVYCDCVASAVGRLCVRIFGLEESAGVALAHHLGRALQMTNILRDLDEDARLGRLYLPREYLEDAGIRSGDPAAVLSHPALDAACLRLANAAERHFNHADAIAASCSASRVRPALIMADAYRRILRGMRQRGWAAPRARIRLKRYEIAGIILRRVVLDRAMLR